MSSRSTSDWYCLLRTTQGSLIQTLEAGYALSTDSDEEFNYVIDLNKNIFYIKEFPNIFTLTNIPDDWETKLKYEDEELNSASTMAV